ncbi:CDP-diacylglycerol--inositol 3-phosphatidyltransferase [Planctomycetes bacterium CA13]|uniref:CDP-diacylglycerol--serine O-phosphatidyltransferase n=1 Tax=Novipirellula herctigrandis TaxID=2527986 RepID=A0A5C5Z9X3_9BACT|nr:CDP-diacylglycerol--inositol 3-phosphatidyltransferase [Planctomycetes bacterium CA13]
MSELKRTVFGDNAAGHSGPDNGSGMRDRKGRKRLRRRISLAFLPTLLTLGNAVCGLAAVSVAVSVNLPWPDEIKLFAAGVLIFAGMLFDALDGSAARMTGQESRFGAELDSLCDVITFGVAPAVIVWRISDVFPQKLSWAIGVLFTLCVLIRLARFNVETGEEDSHEGFEGLPSPAAAGTIAAFAIAMPDVASIATDEVYPEFAKTLAQGALDASHYVIPLLAVILSYLMTSRFQYLHVFQQLVTGRWSTHQFGQALFAIVGGFLLHWVALPIGFCYYSFGPPVRQIVRRERDVTCVEEKSSAESNDE